MPNTDNAVSQQVLNNGAACTFEIWLFTATHSCHIEILHKPGKDFILADALSGHPADRNAHAVAVTISTQRALTEIAVDFTNILTTRL